MAHHFKCLHNHFTMNWNSIHWKKKAGCLKRLLLTKDWKYITLANLRSLSKKGEKERKRERDFIQL